MWNHNIDKTYKLLLPFWDEMKVLIFHEQIVMEYHAIDIPTANCHSHT